MKSLRGIHQYIMIGGAVYKYWHLSHSLVKIASPSPSTPGLLVWALVTSLMIVTTLITDSDERCVAQYSIECSVIG